jgi:ankyrin repeat protein
VGKLGDQIVTKASLPPYVIPGSEVAEEWKLNNPRGYTARLDRMSFATGSTEAHRAAIQGDVNRLRSVLDQHQHLGNVRDENGWQALHEAVRTGVVDAVQLLLDRGAELNRRTGRHDGENGDSPLDVAIKAPWTSSSSVEAAASARCPIVPNGIGIGRAISGEIPAGVAVFCS